MSNSINKLMRKFKYDDKRIEHLLEDFDDLVEAINGYDDQFEFSDKKDETAMLSGYQNTAFGILLSLLQLGHITTADFHHRMHALNLVFFKKTGY
ncbi:hypothetical protein [Gallionella capsiferriformans]|uniref:Uncharacterized protein n=1 Tax=Gallionella capsiferriformans (strain ES-2) TaxID=395494 RepID=D9SD40_GALCS|nr:hypothetical protein [Gallionella capsiferriformans]ADL54729.1 hypothetical protein Galf_0689 [Gallionella capsiferriformans ES-2]